ncbi:hypothetical protein ACFLTW_04575 [Chloroflexota bacterium]
MEISAQQRAINGLIDLWEDICFIQGKGHKARQLKPYIQTALIEPGSVVHRLIEYLPDREEWYTHYDNYSRPGLRGKVGKIVGGSVGQRRKIISHNLTKKTIQDLALLLKHGMYILGSGCHSMGVSAAEVERRIYRQYEDALSDIPLKELIKDEDNTTYENEIRNLMAKLGLSTGSVAGMDIRLKEVLTQRLRSFMGKTPSYEHDLKAALWECAKGNKHMQHEILKLIEGDPPRPIDDQITLIMRVARGQERKLIRGTIFRIIRKTIADLPDVSEELLKKHRAYNRGQKISQEEKRLEGASALKDTLMSPIKSIEESVVDGIQEPALSPTDLLKNIGITQEETSPVEWETLMLLSRKVLDGELELGSKVGLSISAVLENDAARVRKVISRYRKKHPYH